MRRETALLIFVPLLGGLVGCDAMGGSTDSIVAPPPTFTIRSRTPGPGREGVPTSVALVITFSADIDPATVAQGSVTANGASAGTLEVKGPNLTFTPAGGWPPGSSVAIALSPQIAGLNGVAVGPIALWGFKTAGVPPVGDTVQLAPPRPR
ncbi:MAG TPA: Ig-like domain-containing protein [Gemmatimonadales bacterium]|nr:Ig-like domain-containing protein [Gemmatimonadales bacterium]